MAIGKTGNKIVDDIARARSKAQADEKRVKAAAKKAANAGKGRGWACRGKMRRKSAIGMAKSGRLAVKSGKINGRGVAIKSHKNGGSLRNIVHYASTKDEAEFVCGSGGLAAMEALARRVAKCKKPAGHITASLPPSTGKKSLVEWKIMADEIRNEIGIDDSYAYQVWRHNDAAHDHIHIVFCRVNVHDQIHNQQFIGLRCAAAERLIEGKCNLPLIITPPENRMPSLRQGEAAKAIKSGTKPPKFVVAEAIANAKRGQPTIGEFIERLKQQGIGATPNISTTGKMNGFSFVIAGVSFKGSQVCAKWSELKEEVLYEPNSGLENIAEERKGSTSGIADEQREVSKSYEAMEPPRGGIQPSAKAEQAVTKPADGFTQSDRRARTTKASVGVRERLALLRANSNARRVKYAKIRARINRDRSPIAVAFCSALEHTKTETELASEFLSKHKCSVEARAMIELLDLAQEHRDQVMAPYKEMLKNEAAFNARMENAIRSTSAVNGGALEKGNLPTL